MENSINDKEIGKILEEQIDLLKEILANLKEEQHGILTQDSELIQQILLARIPLIQKLHALRELIPDEYYIETPFRNQLKELIHQIDMQNSSNQILLEPKLC